MKSFLKKKKKTANNKQEAIEPEVIDAESIESELIEPEDVVTKPKKSKQKPISALAPTDPVAAYLAEIGKYKVLSREEEKVVAEDYYETGDPKAAEKLVTANLRFVVKIAAEYSKFGNKMIDLIQEGNVGLMHAVREYNPYKGVRLISYAVWWIRGYIQDYLMKQHSLVKIGTSQKQRKLYYQLKKQKDEMDRLGPNQVIAQLSGKLDIPEKDIIDMSQRVLSRDVSLSQPLNDNDTGTLMDLQTSPEEIAVDTQLGNLEELENLREHIDNLKPTLNERELFILEKRILADEPMTLQEIGKMNNVTREAVRQMEARVLQKIKNEVLGDE